MSLLAYRVQLATELISDIEHYRLPAEQLLYKARRLAHAVGDDDVEEWIGFELAGYPVNVPERINPYLMRVGRWQTRRITEDESRAVKFANIAGLSEPALSTGSVAVVIRRESLPRIEDYLIPSTDAAFKHNADVAKSLTKRPFRPASQANVDPSKWEEILSGMKRSLIDWRTITQHVRAELHAYVTSVHTRFAFTEVATAIFERHKASVDAILKDTAADVVEKVPAIYDRLREASHDTEAISQAMSSCRRMIVAFADAVQPATQAPVVTETGETHQVGKAQPLNRIDEYMRVRCSSNSRRERLSRTIRLIHDRVSAGMKADMTSEEAQSLFLLTYLSLGEIASVE